MTPDCYSNWLTSCAPGHGLLARGRTVDMLRANRNPAVVEAALTYLYPLG